MSPELEAAVAAARRATDDLHGLLTEHGIQFKELHRLPVWPVGLREAHRCWTYRMVDVVRAIARDEGLPDPATLSEDDQFILTFRAHDFVMN